MMDYYEKKKTMFKIVESLIANGNMAEDDLIFEAERNTGFSKKTIKAYLESVKKQKVKE